MTKLQFAKKATSIVVGIGTGKVVASILSNNAPAGGIVTKITCITAGVVIGMMASDATSKYTEDKIDEAVIWWKENVK